MRRIVMAGMLLLVCGIAWIGAPPRVAVASGTETPAEAAAEPDEPTEAVSSGVADPSDAEESTEGATESAAPQAPLFDYVPPDRGAPSNRIGGGTRGDDDAFLVAALVPEDHIGRTTQEAPVLYWYRSPTAKGRIEFVLNDETSGTTRVRETLSPPAGERFPSVDTGAFGARLETDRLYSWFVTVVVDPADPSLDMLSGGYIRRIATPPELAKSLNDASTADRAALYARAGVWYDALALLMERIREHPGDAELVAQREWMLKAAGLPTLPD